MNTDTTCATETTLEQARALARGCYQRAILDGAEAWSGSTLKGKASRYGGRYRASRYGLLGRLQAAGIRAYVEARARGKLVLVVETMGPRNLVPCHEDCDADRTLALECLRGGAS